MKKVFLLIFIVLTISCCNNDDDNKALPPATQTGAGTFACYVNGKTFIDKSGGWFNCFYQLVDGAYYFNIRGIFQNQNTPYSIALGTEAKTISEGEVLQLIEREEGNAWGGVVYIYSPTEYFGVHTSTEYTGELTITKLDFENNIVSGTFWFDLEHPVTGERVEIREGRFDTLFTQ